MKRLILAVCISLAACGQPPPPSCPSTQPGCPGYVAPPPACPVTQPGCPGYVAPPTDYGTPFVGTWSSSWYECSATPCGGSTGVTPLLVGTWTANITEPQLNNMVINSSFTDNYAANVSCTDTSVVTAEANDGYGNSYNGSATVASLAFTVASGASNLGVCTANGACADFSAMTVTLQAAIGDLFANGDLLLEWKVSQSCNGQAETEYYIIEPLIKSAAQISGLDGLPVESK